MSPSLLVQLALSACAFLGAAGAARSWAIEPASWKLFAALVLYTIGNLITLRSSKIIGLVPAFAVSGMFQLVAVTVLAYALLSGSLGEMEWLGVSLGALSVLLITLAPWLGLRRR